MSAESELLAYRPEELYEDAPCGYLATRLDGTILQVNRTFETLTGLAREDLIERVRFQDLFFRGSRIYYETHYSPLLSMQGAVRELAIDITRSDGTLLPVLVNSVIHRDSGTQTGIIRTSVFDATDRRRYEQELLRARKRETAHAEQLQRSLLSGTLPDAVAVETDVFYRAAVKGTETGGDWYDAFWLEEEVTLALVVGDVVGRGIPAAATMGQLRSAIRAFAATGLGPAALLSALDDYSRRHRVGAMTTVVYAQLEVATGTVRFACAGHPPPVLQNPGEDPAFCWGGRSEPINVFDTVEERPEAQITIAPNGRLLLYTDGLYDHPGRGDDPLDRLLAAVTDRVSLPFGDYTAALAEDLREPEESDDVCVLAVRRH